MDLSCIISSGDLELYVLGMLPEEDAFKVEQLALLFPEVQQELDRISEALEGFARTTEINPPAHVKSNLMGKLANLKNQEQDIASTASVNTVKETTTERQEPRSIPEVIPMKKRTWLQAASIIAIVVALGIIVVLANQNSKNKKELTSTEHRLNAINRNLVEQQRQTVAFSEMLRMYESDQYKKVRLTSVPGKPQATAQVFWDTKTSEVYIADISLPLSPAHKQYQLWAIVDGKPVDAGVLDSSKQKVQRMKAFTKADAFAITLERRGGSATPTVEEMYVMGKTS